VGWRGGSSRAAPYRPQLSPLPAAAPLRYTFTEMQFTDVSEEQAVRARPGRRPATSRRSAAGQAGALLPWLLAAALAAGCGHPRPAPPHVRLGHGVDAARAAFNADSGRVRVVLLLSPT